METSELLGERLEDLISENHMCVKELSAKTGISCANIYRWKRNSSDILLKNLNTLANCFHCSLDFLLGKSDEELAFQPKELPNFGLHLRAVLKEKGISMRKFYRDTKYDTRCLKDWSNGTSPYSATLLEIAKYLDCSVDFLTGREN